MLNSGVRTSWATPARQLAQIGHAFVSAQALLADAQDVLALLALRDVDYRSLEHGVPCRGAQAPGPGLDPSQHSVVSTDSMLVPEGVAPAGKRIRDRTFDRGAVLGM